MSARAESRGLPARENQVSGAQRQCMNRGSLSRAGTKLWHPSLTQGTRVEIVKASEEIGDDAGFVDIFGGVHVSNAVGGGSMQQRGS